MANEYDSLIADVKSDENARQEEVTAWEEIKEACNITINKKEDNIIVKSKFKKRLLLQRQTRR